MYYYYLYKSKADRTARIGRKTNCKRQWCECYGKCEASSLNTETYNFDLNRKVSANDRPYLVSINRVLDVWDELGLDEPLTGFK